MKLLLSILMVAHMYANEGAKVDMQSKNVVVTTSFFGSAVLSRDRSHQQLSKPCIVTAYSPAKPIIFTSHSPAPLALGKAINSHVPLSSPSLLKASSIRALLSPVACVGDQISSSSVNAEEVISIDVVEKEFPMVIPFFQLALRCIAYGAAGNRAQGGLTAPDRVFH